MSERAPSRNENHLLHVGYLTALPAERTQRLLDKLRAVRPEVGIDMIGATRIVNPGPLSSGGYAYAEFTRWGLRVECRRV